LKVLPPSPIFKVQIINAGSQHVEVLASKSAEGNEDWECIVHKSMLRSPAEVKEGKARDRNRSFTTDSTLLNKSATESSWVRLKVICSCPEDMLREFDRLSSDNRQQQGLMGLAQLKAWHGLDVFASAAAPCQSEREGNKEKTAEGAVNTKASSSTSSSALATLEKGNASRVSAIPSSNAKSAATTKSSAPKEGVGGGGGGLHVAAPIAKKVVNSAAPLATSQRLQPSSKFAHWTKPKDMERAGGVCVCVFVIVCVCECVCVCVCVCVSVCE